MTDKEQANFNRALATLNKLERLLQVTRRLENKIDILGAHDAIALLRKVEELI